MLSRLSSQQQVLVYVCDLRRPPEATSGAAVPVSFKINAPEALTRLRADGARYGVSAADLPALAPPDGDVIVSGWLGDALIAHAWIGFTAYCIASTRIPLGPKHAFIYRCAVVEADHSHGVEVAALRFGQFWLRDRGYERVFIETRVDDRASRKAVADAGFELLSSYWIRNVLGHPRVTIPDALRTALSGS